MDVTMDFLLKLVVVFGIIGISSCQVVRKGSCPDVTVQEDFDVTKYTGRWYEQKRFFAIFQMFSMKVTAEYTLYPDGVSVKVNNTGIDRFYNSISTEIGVARIADETYDSKLSVQFPGSPAGKYWVLSTDYENYSVVWSCTDEMVGPITFNTQLSWILTRQPEGVGETKTEELLNMMRSQGIDTSHFNANPQM